MINSGNNCIKYQIPPNESIVQAKPAIIFNSVCPDIIFAKSRIARLKTLVMYDTSSIGINNGASARLTPLGRKNPKKCSPCSRIAIIFIPVNSIKAKLNVTNRWLVIVKLYGIIPIKFVMVRNENRKKIKGKNRSPS
jgi:hypothetical protein